MPNLEPRKMHQEILTQHKPNVEEHHLAGAPHLADDLPPGVTDSAAACPGRSLPLTKEKGPQNF